MIIACFVKEIYILKSELKTLFGKLFGKYCNF